MFRIDDKCQSGAGHPRAHARYPAAVSWFFPGLHEDLSAVLLKFPGDPLRPFLVGRRVGNEKVHETILRGWFSPRLPAHTIVTGARAAGGRRWVIRIW